MSVVVSDYKGAVCSYRDFDTATQRIFEQLVTLQIPKTV
jgi:hypothetical protein